MKLSINLPFGKKEKKEYFLSLLLRDEKVNAVIFEESNGKVQLVGENEKHFETSIEQQSTEELLQDLDETISAAESSLPSNIETHKTIFGVKEDWVEGSGIKKEYLGKLKKISDSLGLSPIGFLVIQEAIAHLMQKEEGAPVSAILLEVGKQNLAVSLLRAGRILETKRTKIEDDIPTTTDRILHHFTQYEVLPSRIVIFDEGNAEELSQDFIGHSWTKSLPFLHVPQITVLPKGFDARAILFGAATQMGFEVLGDVKEEELPKQVLEKHPVKEKSGTLQEAIESSEIETVTKKPLHTKEIEEAEGSFGFMKEVDITPVSHQKIREKEISLPEEMQFGTPGPLEKIKPILAMLFGFVFLLFAKIQKVFASLHLPLPSASPRGKMFFIPPIAIAFIIILLLLYVFGLKADITLAFRPKIIEEKQNVVFSQGPSTDTKSNYIQATLFDVQEEGNISVPATGKKEVGDKAKGSVTIYNSSLSEGKTFAKGSVITSSNNLDFVLDNAVSVASASGDASSIQSSTAKISVTAEDIGKEYNLPSGTKFAVGSLSQTSVIAKNDSAFSGGSKKEVTVVSKADLNKASDELLKKLSDKAKEDAIKKISETQALLPVFIASQLSKQDFSKNAGDQADTLTLKAIALFKGTSYKKSELEKFAKTLLSTKQQNMTYSDDGISYSLEKVEKLKDDNIQAVLTTKASLIPKIDTKKLSSDLAGKSFEEAQAFLYKLPQASDVRIKLIPPLPFLPKALPKRSENIKFSITTHE